MSLSSIFRKINMQAKLRHGAEERGEPKGMDENEVDESPNPSINHIGARVKKTVGSPSAAHNGAKHAATVASPSATHTGAKAKGSTASPAVTHTGAKSKGSTASPAVAHMGAHGKGDTDSPSTDHSARMAHHLGKAMKLARGAAKVHVKLAMHHHEAGMKARGSAGMMQGDIANGEGQAEMGDAV